jgi:hypothetical protein
MKTENEVCTVDEKANISLRDTRMVPHRDTPPINPIQETTEVTNSESLEQVEVSNDNEISDDDDEEGSIKLPVQQQSGYTSGIIGRPRRTGKAENEFCYCNICHGKVNL